MDGHRDWRVRLGAGGPISPGVREGTSNARANHKKVDVAGSPITPFAGAFLVGAYSDYSSIERLDPATAVQEVWGNLPVRSDEERNIGSFEELTDPGK